jgi:transglutaminase-like putative cysteine protease
MVARKKQQNTRAKRWVEMHFPRSEMRIGPRNDQTTQTTETKTTTHKNGPEPNATKTKQPPVAVMGTARAHHCRQTNLQTVND